jgi:anti-sigma factor RsiW
MRTSFPKSSRTLALELPPPNKIHSLVPFGLGLALGLVLATLSFLFARRPDPVFAETLVEDHVRSLMADHLTDVLSTDRHTVKPWFLGKIDFAPSVPDLRNDGFPLIGGRLEYVRGTPAAALVYRRNGHVINVFVARHEGSRAESQSSRGFHIVRWTVAGLDYWAVSDLEETELHRFADRFARS